MIDKILKIIVILFLGYYAGQYVSQLVLSRAGLLIKVSTVLLPFMTLIFIIKPKWSFMALLFIRPLIESFSRITFMKGINLLGAFSFVNVIFVIYLLIKEKNTILFPKNLKWFYLYIIIAFVASIESPDFMGSIIMMLKLLSLTALFILGYNLSDNKDDAIRILKIVLIASVIPISIGLYQYFSGLGVQAARWGELQGVRRINGTFDLSNGFAFYLGLIILISILCSYHSKGMKEKCFYFVILGGASVCLLFTYVRSSWIAIAIAILTLAIFERKARKWLIFLIPVILALSWNYILARFEDVINPSVVVVGGLSSFEFRIEVTKQLFSNAIPSKLFLGYGLGQSKNVIMDFTRFTTIPHNDYLRVLIETGALGLIVFLLFLGQLFFHLFRLVRRKVNVQSNSVFLSILIFYLVSSTSENLLSYISTSGYIFCFMGFAQKINDISEIREQSG